MIFVNDNNEVLETKGDVAITKQAASFFGFKIKGDVSVNFTIPNNSDTRDKLNYNGPQMTNQVAFTRQSWNLMDNGNVFMKGSIVIQNETDKELDCYFVSGNSNWINLLNGLITTLDFSSYRIQITYANVSSLISATSGITFPMVDWCYNLKKGNNEWQLSKIFDKSGSITSENDAGLSTPVSVGDYYSEFYPCFFLSSLVNEIFQQNGLKYSGTLFNDPIFNRLIITPYQGKITRDVPNVSANGTLFTPVTLLTGVYEKYDKFVESYDPEGLFSSSRYTATRYCLLKISVFTITNLDNHMADFQIRKNNTPLYILPGSSAPFDIGLTWIYEMPVVPGDYIEVWVSRYDPSPAVATCTLNIDIEANNQIGPNDYVTPNDFLFPYKQIDIIKFIINYFGCVSTFDEYSKTVTINIIDKIRRENSQDWSEYYISHRSEYTVNQAQNNFVKLLDPDDSVLINYNKINEEQFGGGNITTNNRLKYSNDLFTIPFAPSDFGQSINVDWLSNIKLVDLSDDTATAITYTSISNGAPLAQYEFAILAGDPNPVVSGEICRIITSTGDLIGYFIVDSVVGISPGVRAIKFLGLDYTLSNSGTIYKQTIQFNDIQTRLLLTKPSTIIDHFSDGVIASTYHIYENGSANSLTTAQYAFFAKKITLDTIDSFKASASWGDINDVTFNDPVIQELYFRNISSILNNPNIRAQMLLPKSVYQSFDFSTFIYIRSEKLTGYFFVDSIVNYQDASTPVEVNLYML